MPYIDKENIDDLIDALIEMNNGTAHIDDDRIKDCIFYYIGNGKKYKNVR